MSRREILFGLVLGIAAAAHALDAARRGEGVDFFHYWMVPHLFAVGEGPGVYDADGSGRLRGRLAEALGRDAPRDPYRDRAASYWQEFQVTNTPLCYLLLSPFATRDFATGYFAFQHLGIACLFGGVLGLGRLCGLSWLDGVVAAATATLCFECVVSDIRVGNLNRLLLGWIAAAAWLASRPDTCPWGIVAGGLLAYLLTARLAWLHYYVLAIPSLLFLAGRIRRGRPAWFVIASLAAAVAIAVRPVLQATALDDPVLTMGLMVAGGWLAFGLALRELLVAEAPCGA